MAGQPRQTDVRVRAQLIDGALLEHYTYTPGRTEPLSMHAHDEYQLALSFNTTGEYHYRRARRIVPVYSLAIIHPGELHAPSQRSHIPAPASYWMMYLHPNRVWSLVMDVAPRCPSLPFFTPDPIFDDDLNAAYLALFDDHAAAQLEQDTRLQTFLERLTTRHAALLPAPAKLSSARRNVLRARDFLADHYTKNVSLAELAQVANLSQYHLNRTFRHEFGITPHAYQTQMRVARARVLLATGESPAEVAAATGFYDQSHLNRHFKRLVGVTSGGYANYVTPSARSS